MPPFTASSLRSRSLPLLTASALSLTLYTAHLHLRPVLSDDTLLDADADTGPSNKLRSALPTSLAPVSPYVPLGWGSNRYLTLFPDPSIAVVKRPTPLVHLGATPYRDLAIAEKYGACVDANGDCWMWGAGYDPSGEIGQSLRNRKLRTLAPGPGKLFALSKDGRLYCVSAVKAFQDHRQDRSEQTWWSWLFSSDAGVDHVEVKPEGGFRRGERWTGVSTGIHHLLAVTNKGRTFSLPLSPSGNSHRQLGTWHNLTGAPGAPGASEPVRADELPAEVDPRFAPALHEIKSLSGIDIAQVAASDRTSFVRTPGGRVLGFGANESGQIGLGGSAAVEIVQTPVEVVLARNYPGGTMVKALDVIAGGSTTMFVVERESPGQQGKFVDLLACGNGMSGALGNGLWSSASSVPTRVKTVSGLQEFSEKAKAFLPLELYAVSVSPSPNAHIFAVLKTDREADAKGVKDGLYGKDVMVWGGNAEYQLGNGKRSSLATPQHLPRLIPREAETAVLAAAEAAIGSGTTSPMPHSRLQLHATKADAYNPLGKLLKRGVKCEEAVVAGYNASVLYNKIVE